MELSYKELAQKASISESYATQILDGSRTPSLLMAFQIYDATDLQFGLLKGLSEATIEELRPKAAA